MKIIENYNLDDEPTTFDEAEVFSDEECDAFNDLMDQYTIPEPEVPEQVDDTTSPTANEEVSSPTEDDVWGGNQLGEMPDPNTSESVETEPTEDDVWGRNQLGEMPEPSDSDD